MEALNLPESITIRFKATPLGRPESRQETREALARACEGHPVTVIDGFTGIKPYEPHRAPATRKISDRKGYSRTRKQPRLLTDEVLDKVGGEEALAAFLGLHLTSVKRWGSNIPERHDLITRELLRNWKKLSLAMPVLADNQPPAAAARAAGISLEELLSLCDRFHVTATKK